MQLARDDCLSLLATAFIGRVLYTDRALPAAQPVKYLLDGEEIVVRTRPGTRLAVVVTRNVVAFQVDEIDPRTHVGWSVCGVGPAYEIVDPARVSSLTTPGPPARTPDESSYLMAIPLERLSGQRLALT